MASGTRTSTDREIAEPQHAPATSSVQSLSKAVHARRSEYTRPQKIKVKIGTWNVAACPGTENDLGAWFVDGKGVDLRLAGLDLTVGAEHDPGKKVESVGAQEGRHSTRESTIPRGDQGTIVGGDDIGLYVLGLQEVVELTSAKEYIGRVYTDLGPMTKWRKALSDALPPDYQLISEQQLSGLLLLVYASPEIAPTISSVSSVSVGTGIMGYLGNKGAVSTRIVLGETTRIVLVNCHLASGSDPAHLDRRCWDVAQILQRTHFEPINWGGVFEDEHEVIGQEDFAFWFGDLNFRLDGLPGEDIRRLLMLHAKGEYDLGRKSGDKVNGELGTGDEPILIHSIESDDDSLEDSVPRTSSNFDHGDDASSNTLPDPDDFIQDPSQNPASLQATLDSLLPHDQLRRMCITKKAFHDGWREGPVTFLPTYKYDVGSIGMFDSSEKKRAPSWCDRILYRTGRDKLEYEARVKEEELARIKDSEMTARGMDHAGDDENVLFDYNPDEDGTEDTTANIDYDEYDENADENGLEPVVAQDEFVDKIQLGSYTSHQRVLSSDHKPLDAVFTIEYDAVVPELKSKIQQEVARELDRAENEGRPGITVVADHSQDSERSAASEGPKLRRTSTGSAESINFGDVALQQRKHRSLTVANTSQVPATFAFVPRPSEAGEDDRIASSWLKVCFVDLELDQDKHKGKELMDEVTLEPGDAVNATLEIFVDDMALIRRLNSGTAKLEDVLVLRVTDGRDHFIPVHGSWLPSCFGRSIDELIRVPEGGVRALKPSPNDGGLKTQGREVCWSAPRELFKLTEAVESLTDRVMAEAHMLESTQLPRDAAGWPFDEKSWTLKNGAVRETLRRTVLEALDTDKNLKEPFPAEVPPTERLEIMAEVLIMFLDSLTDGIITEELWGKLEQDFIARGANPAADVEDTKTWVLDTLSASPNHNISFVFLTSMLSRVAGELAPIPKTRRSRIASSARSSLDAVRQTFSLRGKPPALAAELAVVKRQAVERAYGEVFAHVIFRGGGGAKERERKGMEERRREIVEVFVQGGRERG